MLPKGPEYPVDAVGERIDLSHCRLLDRTLRNWGLYEEGGSRIFTFRTKTKNSLEFSPLNDDLAGVSFQFAHLAPLRWELQIEFAARLRSDGTQIISVDPDDRYLDALPRNTMMQLLDGIDLFLPSKQDVDALMPGKTRSRCCASCGTSLPTCLSSRSSAARKACCSYDGRLF